MTDATRTITIEVSMGLVGCRKTATLDVEADATDEQIDEMARDVLHELIEWSWS
jgi:hypothetical protein